MFDIADAGAAQHATGASDCAPRGAPSACARHCRFIESAALPAQADSPIVPPFAKFARHATVYTRGERALFSYKVVEGAVRLSRVLMDGHRQVLEILLPNDTFGIEIEDTYDATAECISDALLLRCPRVCISCLNEERP